MRKTNRRWWGSIVLLVGANGLILAQAAPWLRYGAALVLLLLLPGWLWWEAMFAMPLNRAGRITFAIGLSLALTIVGTILAVYAAGALTTAAVLVMANTLSLAGLFLTWRGQPPGQRPPPPQTGLLLLALVLLLAAALRLPRLGYAEFHEDEAEALMLGVRLLQGEDYALFLHRKGPAQMLAPVAVWLLTGQLTETLARLPFALSSIFSVLAIYLLGRRWFGLPAALLAALLWAINGYSIAFGRLVQYQALIFFMGPLAIYALYLAWAKQQPRLQILAAILLAACLLAHFDALLLLPAAGYLLIVTSRRPNGTADNTQRRSLFLSLSLFLLLLAIFYVPFVLDPEFQNTTAYLTESRVKPGLLYNNLDRLRRLDRDYSSHFYLPLLATGLIAFILLKNRLSSPPASSSSTHASLRLRSGQARFTLHVSRFIFLLLVLTATTFWFPKIWEVGGLSLAIGPWLLLLGFCFWQAPTTAERAAWLLFGVPLLGYGFLVEDPRTHLYILYPGAVLLAGAGLHDFGFWILDFGLSSPTAIRNSQSAIRNPQSTIHNSQSAIRSVVVGIAAIWIALVVLYLAIVFLQSESTFTTLRAGWDGSLWETVYDDLPRPREYFGYPKREGWKAIGALQATGHLPGDFRSINEEFVIPIWYTYGQARSCYDTPAHFFIRLADLTESPALEGYVNNGRIEREGDVRLQIVSRPALATSNKTYQLADFTAAFDQQATPRRFAQQNEPSQRAGTRFGSVIEFTGYDLSTTEISPEETFDLNLYWRALASPQARYRAFVHLTDGVTLWAQQDDDPACRLPTDIWRKGQHSMGQFRLAVDPDTPPGRYPLIIGLYEAETLERLMISGGSGQPGDDFLWLGDVVVVAPPE